MTSPCRRHLMKQLAEKNAQQGHSILQNSSGYSQMLLKLMSDRRRLKRIQSNERKAKVKQEILPSYAPWVAGVLEAGTGNQDDVLMYLMLWRIDAGDYVGALDIAQYALAHNLSMPEGHTRTTGCAVAEEIADAATRQYAVKDPISLAILQRTVDLTISQDMPDQVRANLYKWLGYAQRDNNMPQPATCSWIRALELNDRVGVKKDLDQLQKAIVKQQALEEQ